MPLWCALINTSVVHVWFTLFFNAFPRKRKAFLSRTPDVIGFSVLCISYRNSWHHLKCLSEKVPFWTSKFYHNNKKLHFACRRKAVLTNIQYLLVEEHEVTLGTQQTSVLRTKTFMSHPTGKGKLGLVTGLWGTCAAGDAGRKKKKKGFFCFFAFTHNVNSFQLR